jgi:hypothetical protein
MPSSINRRTRTSLGSGSDCRLCSEFCFWGRDGNCAFFVLWVADHRVHGLWPKPWATGKPTPHWGAPATDEFPVFPQALFTRTFVRIRRCIQLEFMNRRDALLELQLFRPGIGAWYLHFLDRHTRPGRFSGQFPHELANVGMAHAEPSGQGATGLLRSRGNVPLPNEMLDSLASLGRSPAGTSLLQVPSRCFRRRHGMAIRNRLLCDFDRGKFPSVSSVVLSLSGTHIEPPRRTIIDLCVTIKNQKCSRPLATPVPFRPLDLAGSLDQQFPADGRIPAYRVCSVMTRMAPAVEGVRLENIRRIDPRWLSR